MNEEEALCLHERSEWIAKDYVTACLAGLTDDQAERTTDMHITSCSTENRPRSHERPSTALLPSVEAMNSPTPIDASDRLIRSISGRVGTIIFFTDEEIDPTRVEDSIDKCPMAQPHSSFQKETTGYIWFCAFIVPDAEFVAGSASFNMALRRKRDNSLVTWIPGVTLEVTSDAPYGMLLTGYGATDPGMIDSGEYRLEVFTDSVKVGEGSFSVN